MKYFTGLDAPVQLPVGTFVSFLAKSQRAKPVGPKKNPCYGDPMKIGQPWSSAFSLSLGYRKGISIFIFAHLAPFTGSKNKEVKCTAPYHLLLLVKSRKSLIAKKL